MHDRLQIHYVEGDTPYLRRQHGRQLRQVFQKAQLNSGRENSYYCKHVNGLYIAIKNTQNVRFAKPLQKNTFLTMNFGPQYRGDS